MVRVQVKHGEDGGCDDETEFLYDCPTTTSVDDLAEDLTEISNLQSTIKRLAIELEPRLSLLHRDNQVINLSRALSEAKSYISKDQVLHNKPLLSYMLKDLLKNVGREFSSSYQIMGFPDSSLKQLLTDLELLQEDTVDLLWAGKKLSRGKPLCDYIGNNEKTKVIEDKRVEGLILLPYHQRDSSSCILKLLVNFVILFSRLISSSTKFS